MLYINLDTKTVKSGKTYLINKGIPQNGCVIDKTPITFPVLEELYTAYKHSVPNNVKYKKNHFKALSYDNLTTEDLIIGSNREKAKENLELAIITGVLNGSLQWPDDTKWFWQSDKDKDFVLLKRWIA